MKNYAPKVFKIIRKRFGIANELSYINSVGDDCNPLSGQILGEGKSGMLFFISHDKKYIVKTVKRSEAKFLVDNLKSYS